MQPINGHCIQSLPPSPVQNEEHDSDDGNDNHECQDEPDGHVERISRIGLSHLKAKKRESQMMLGREQLRCNH